MRDKYDNFLHRLNQYRLRLNMTQEETGSELGVTQSQFSKMELGKIIIPYKVLVLLMKMGWDVDYFITGKETCQSISELNLFMDGVEERYRKELLSAVVWFLEQGINKCVLDISFETKCEIGILKRGQARKNLNQFCTKRERLPELPRYQCLKN